MTRPTVRRLRIHEHRHEITGRIVRHAHHAYTGQPHDGYGAARDTDRTATRPVGPQLQEA